MRKKTKLANVQFCRNRNYFCLRIEEKKKKFDASKYDNLILNERKILCEFDLTIQFSAFESSFDDI